jgi:predicted RNase H-like HicB family nuclease/uncharacterized damage-inducible protein DinB
MPYIVCAEEMEGLWIAHVPDLPGCYASHRDRDTAIKAVPAAVDAYITWCREHGMRVSGVSGPMVVTEIIRSWIYDEEYEVNAFFASDRPPLLAEELPEFERLMHASREDLEREVEDLNEEQLVQEIADDWTIHRTLSHIANSEWWYFDRMGLAFPRAELPQDVFERLEMVRGHSLANLEALAARTGVVTLAGETWSGRKVLRRTLWHERDHTQHVRKLRGRLR